MFKRIFTSKKILLWSTVVLSLLSAILFTSTSVKSEKIENTSIMSENSELVYTRFLDISQEELFKKIKKGEVTGVIESGDILYMVTEDGEELKIKKNFEIMSYLSLYNLKATSVYNFSSIIENDGKSKEIGTETVVQNFVLSYISSFIFIGLICLVTYSCLTSEKEKKFVEKKKVVDGQSEDDSSVPKIGFNDVYGIDGLKEDINRIVDFLKNKDKYLKMGARPPKGIILYGPPGTGKTLIAKAIAGEAGVPFFSAVGSDFVEVYVGTGAKRVRELYQQARLEAPSIVFIDEVDAIARKRGSDKSNSEDDKTINALLAELDGFDGNSDVITICATNRLDMLDSAFQRAGRFDLKLAVGLPDVKARYEILKIHSKNKVFDDNVDLYKIAIKTPGFSGAELEALLNESALLAVSLNKESISEKELDEAFYKIILKGNKKGVSEINRIKYITAWHEAGHTLATKLLTNDKVPTVTIVSSSSGAGGVTFRAPEEMGMESKKYLRSLVQVMLAGRVGEELYLSDEDDITTGASEDIKQATNILKMYVCKYGMGSYGMLDLEQFNCLQNEIVKECERLVKELYDSVKDLFIENIDMLESLSNALIDKETLTEIEIDKIISVCKENRNKGV